MEHNGLSYDAAANLMLAYCTMQQLEKAAKEYGYRACSLIDVDNDGELYFKVDHVGGEIGRAFLKDINTEEASIFAQKIEVFRAYWTDLMEKAKEGQNARIAELEAELAKLKGRA